MVTLEFGPWEVAVLPECGARLHALRFEEVELLRTPSDPRRHVEEPLYWGSYVMAPWCNRIRRRDAVVFGRRLSLPADPSGPWAIHGQVAARPWRQVGEAAFAIEAGGDGWPWRYEVRQEFGPGLSLAVTLRNLDDAPMPAGLGIHPWYAGDATVTVPARTVMADNTAALDDFVALDGDAELVPGTDATFGDLVASEVPVGNGFRCAFTDSVRVITAARLPGIAAIAVEPQSHAPDGLERLLAGAPYGLRSLAPDEALTIGYRWLAP